jgi:hypothetical protein
MNTKSNWQEAPPTAEEMLAYMRGELSAADEEWVRERLIGYPELVRTLTAPFPEAAEPGDPDYLSDAEFASRWNRNPGRVLQFWPAFGAIAATLAVVFAALFVRERAELSRPRAASEYQALLPDGQRGSGDKPMTVTATGDSYLFVVAVIGQPAFDDFRLQIVDAAKPEEPLWKSRTLRRGPNDTFTILVPRAFLKPGKYQVVLDGVSGARQERVATYTFRV